MTDPNAGLGRIGTDSPVIPHTRAHARARICLLGKTRPIRPMRPVRPVRAASVEPRHDRP
jgi:hypothetical protein